MVECDCVPEFNRNDENRERAKIIDVVVKQWLELLVNNVNIDDSDAIEYFEKLLKFSNKYTSVVTKLVSAYMYICKTVSVYITYL